MSSVCVLFEYRYLQDFLLDRPLMSDSTSSGPSVCVFSSYDSMLHCHSAGHGDRWGVSHSRCNVGDHIRTIRVGPFRKSTRTRPLERSKPLQWYTNLIKLQNAGVPCILRELKTKKLWLFFWTGSRILSYYAGWFKHEHRSLIFNQSLPAAGTWVESQLVGPGAIFKILGCLTRKGVPRFPS